jgi:hypothetical protein
MNAGPWQRFVDAVTQSGNLLVTYLVLALAAAIVVYVVWRVVSGRRRTAAPPPPDLRIDLSALGEAGPPPGPPVVEFYNLPVRIAAIALAPAGRVRDLPPRGQLGEIYEAMAPGLAAVVAAQKPLVRYWPSQLSARGFAQVFFQNVRLPGDRGKGSPWCSAAGLVKVKGQPVMVGLVMRTAADNNLGEVVIDSAEKWLTLIRVRTEG